MATRWRSGCVKVAADLRFSARTRCDQSRGPAARGAPEGSGGHEGADGTAWRLTSDEGKHLRGTDLAPFPLGFFNAGMQSDLYGRVRAVAATRNVALDHVEIRVANHYWLTGSFIHGTGEGHAEAPDIEFACRVAPRPGQSRR